MPSGTAGSPWKEGAVSHRGGFLQNYKKTEQAVSAYSVLVRLRGLEPLPVSGMEPKGDVTLVMVDYLLHILHPRFSWL